MGMLESYRGPSGKILSGLQVDPEEALEKLKALFQRSEVALAYLFGSHARGEAKPTSDIDIAILIRPEDAKGERLYNSFRELMLGVREALGTERFDLLLLNSAPLTLRFEVVSRGRLLYCCDEEVLNAFEMDVIRRFQDTAYLRAVQDGYLRERARKWYSRRKA